MKEVNNIIAIRKRDITLAREAFDSLMSNTESILNSDARENPYRYRTLTVSTLETCAVEKIKEACSNSPFDADEVKLISGQRFPDIVADKYYGIEVKSTKENHWTSTGSSIVETTRVENVADIYMLFGKLGGDVPQFRCRPYEDVLYDIAVTHSPRYLIDMELEKKDTIFSKMGTTYDDFRTSPDSISIARRYYRERAKKNNRQEMPWWITSDNLESAHSFNIRLWNSLDSREKRELQAKCMILFPEALNPDRKMTKYNNTTLWLCSYNQVINPNIRDLYSAGGKITHVDGERLRKPAAQVFNVIVDYSDDIKALLRYPSRELIMMIEDFNPVLLSGEDMYEEWLAICCEFAGKKGVPLREWIEKRPIFTCSK
ncbi:MAG: hypothetical protein ACI3Z0_11650 [Candidatus Cryptobacteroides sp.]